jgi:hypothetical protein
MLRFLIGLVFLNKFLVGRRCVNSTTFNIKPTNIKTNIEECCILEY